MGVGSGRENREQSDRDEPCDCGDSGDVEGPSERESPDNHEGPDDSEAADREETIDREETDESVHVRRLDVGDTLRWSWATLRDRPELVGVALAATLPSVAAAVGVARPAPSADFAVAAWVWPIYAIQFVALAVATGVVYLTAADAVAYRSRPLSARVRAATRRVPSLIGAGFVVALAVGVGLLPTYLSAAEASLAVEFGPLAIGPLADQSALAGLSLVGVLFAAYAFYRLLLAFPACVVDGTGPLASVRAGWDAATGIVTKVFAVGVAYAVASVASAIASGLVGGEYDVTSTLVSAVSGALVLPFFGLALAHLYLEGNRNR